MKKIKMKLAIMLVLSLFLLSNVQFISATSVSTNIHTWSDKKTVSACGDNYTYYLGYLSIYPGKFPDYKPKLEIKFYKHEKLVAPHNGHMVLAVDWEIKKDAFWYTDEVWEFYLTVGLDGPHNPPFLVSKSCTIHDKGDGHDDAGKGVLKANFNPKESSFFDSKSRKVFIDLSVKYDRSGCHRSKDSWEERTIYLENSRPNVPTIKGPSSLKLYEEGKFTACTTDPDGDDIRYQFSFGMDDTWSNCYWSDPYKSGQTITTTHYWPSYFRGKTVEARVRAKDTYLGEVSGWSDPVIIKISKAKVVQPYTTGGNHIIDRNLFQYIFRSTINNLFPNLQSSSLLYKLFK
ncbi:MAG: hypothetical protein DRN33_05960 [Thermoplasmata archaeon]|nr:MAG: hypothetical protein DRN33_05960 [Thermoplasmata archaeon]